MDDAGIENVWAKIVAPRYNEHERARPWATTPDAIRFLVFLWQSCKGLEPENPKGLFVWSLEQLSDECGVNCLQPKPPSELQPPEPWRDLWGNPLPNCFATKDLKGQSLITQRDPFLAEWLKKFAESPYEAACEWKDQQAELLKEKAISYDSDSHVANVFANGANETEKAQFVKNAGGADSALVARCKFEAKPIEFPVGKSFNLSAQSRISRIPKLSALFDAMMNHEREWREGARQKAKADIAEATKHLKELEAAANK